SNDGPRLQNLLASNAVVQALPRGLYPHVQATVALQAVCQLAVEQTKPPIAWHVSSTSMGVTLNHGILPGAEQAAVLSSVTPARRGPAPLRVRAAPDDGPARAARAVARRRQPVVARARFVEVRHVLVQRAVAVVVQVVADLHRGGAGRAADAGGEHAVPASVQ